MELEKKDKNKWIKYWLCKQCYDEGSPKPIPSASTSSCSEHLQRKHNILPPGCSSTETTSSIEPFVKEQYPLQAERWRTCFINWIVTTDTTFEAAANPQLREVIIHGGPIVKDLLPSRNTVRTWLMNTYHERIGDVKASLAASRSRITLSIDGWSAPNDISLLGVVGHWIDQHCNLKTTLLGLRRLNAHDGSEIAQVLGSVITDYNIEDKVAAFQMDNASNNDTALTALMSK
jgi:hypothetical protein